jgi:hypothetical protein
MAEPAGVVRPANPPTREAVRLPIAYVVAIIGVLAAVLLTVRLMQDVLAHVADPARSAYVLITSYLLVLSAYLFVRTMDGDERIEFQSHWGGLGGGLGGWRVSRPLVFLLTTALTFALFANAVTGPRIDLRERYRVPIQFAESKGIHCDDRGIVNGRLVLGCSGKSVGSADYEQFWDHIKWANPAHDDIVVMPQGK